jgi:hypothetical protein
LGYWALRRSGKALGPEPLPPDQDPSLAEVAFGTGERADPSPDPPELSREKSPEGRIVPPDLKPSHPLVRVAAAGFRGAKAPSGPTRWQDRYGARLLKPGPGCLDIAVSRPLVPRALRIMQALLDALERRGYPVAVREGETFVDVLGEEFQIALVEWLRQVRVKRSWGETVDCEPSGRLRLRVGSSWSGAGPSDDPPRLIEARLNRFVAGLVRRALEAKAERARHQSPSAFANLPRVLKPGLRRPRSTPDRYGRCMPSRSATCSWDRWRRWRYARTR